MNPRLLNVVIVIDHPAQQFARAFQLLFPTAGNPAKCLLLVGSGRFYDLGFKRSVSWDIDLLGGYSWARRPRIGLQRAE